MHIDLNELVDHHFVWPNLFFNRKSALEILASFQDDDNLHRWKTKTRPPPASCARVKNSDIDQNVLRPVYIEQSNSLFKARSSCTTT